MKKVAICLLLLAVSRPAFAQFGLGGGSVVFDPTVNGNVIQQFLVLQQAIAQLPGVGQMFQMDPGFQTIVGALTQLQSVQNQAQSLLWQANQWSSLASLSGGCSGWMCANQVQNLASSFQSASYTSTQAQTLYQQMVAVQAAQAWAAAPSQMQPSQGYTLP